MNLFNRNYTRVSIIFIFMCLMALISLPVLCFSQSVSVTEEWLKDKCNLYNTDTGFKKYDQLTFSDNAIIVINTKYLWYDKILFKDIEYIKLDFVDNKKYYYLGFFCKRNNKCLEEGSISDGKYLPDSPRINRVLDLILKTTSDETNVPQRLIKAFLHLIKLKGGNAKLYKEPF